MVSNRLYKFFTGAFSLFYGTNVDQSYYLCTNTSSIIKWTSCPTFDHTGNPILTQQYLDIITASPCFKGIECLGLLEMICSKSAESATYCTLKLRFHDNPKGDALNSLANKPMSFFGWPHRTLPWVHKPSILQCSACLRWGHHVSACKSVFPFCTICSGPHQTHSHKAFLTKGFINSTLTLPRCINCITAKKAANHLATSQECPFFKVCHSCSTIMTLLHTI